MQKKNPYQKKRKDEVLKCITPHAQREQGLCDWDWSPFICMYVYIYIRECSSTLSIGLGHILFRRVFPTILKRSHITLTNIESIFPEKCAFLTVFMLNFGLCKDQS